MFINHAEPSLWFTMLEKQRDKRDPGQEIAAVVEKAKARMEAATQSKQLRQALQQPAPQASQPVSKQNPQQTTAQPIPGQPTLKA